MHSNTMWYKCILVGLKINSKKSSKLTGFNFVVNFVLKPMTVMILWDLIFVTVFLDMKLTHTKNVLTSMNAKEIAHVLMSAKIR